MKDNPRLSLDEIDNQSFGAKDPPQSHRGKEIVLKKGSGSKASDNAIISLDGKWIMTEGGENSERLNKPWVDEIPAAVPCSVHTALLNAGRIPEPTVGRNQEIAREASYKTWWLKRSFKKPNTDRPVRLEFDGIANRCTIWLNGEKISEHEGMFGGPSVDITDLLEYENTLTVKLEPIPKSNDYFMNSDGNQSWNKTVVINNVYGWHYSNMPSLGIWNSVRLVVVPDGELLSPHIFVRDLQKGSIGMSAILKSIKKSLKGTLKIDITPRNFKGDSYTFEDSIEAKAGENTYRYELTVPDFRLWWPVDTGEQNLYMVTFEFCPENASASSSVTQNFGFRTVEAVPSPDGPSPEKFNWNFVVNGKKMFVKGSGWCTADAMLDFSRDRYDCFLSLAKAQHIQMLRAWGCGFPEKDDFYDLCDLYGIMIMQEWPTAWNSHNTQPFDILEYTVKFHTLRLRNHPSLIMYGGGNESGAPFGEAIDMMGRASIELDGTHPFHRGEPWGGSRHDYNVHWGNAPIDYNFTLEADFFGEFGLPSLPVYESVMKYLPDEEKAIWPPDPKGSFMYHTPVFGETDDLNRIRQYAELFIPENYTLKEFITGSQLAQSFGVRPVLERARTRFPYCGGALYYKLNDNFPAASWACADWYGAPKLAHYILMNAFAPLHACLLFDSMNFSGTPKNLPVFLMDDADELTNSKWSVNVTVYANDLSLIKCEKFKGEGSLGGLPVQLGELSLTLDDTKTAPLLTVCEVIKDGILSDRSFYINNCEYAKGSLFRLPRTSLTFSIERNNVIIKNIGKLPAVGVCIEANGKLDTFRTSENFLWLEPGETKTVTVNLIEGLTLSALNSIQEI